MLCYQNIAMCIYLFCIVFIEKCFCSDDQATDGDIFVQKLMEGEAPTIPPLLVFTAPSKLCRSEKDQECMGKRLALSFPLVIGENAAVEFEKHFPKDKSTMDSAFTERPTFTTTIKYCLEGRKCFHQLSTPEKPVLSISEDTVKHLKLFRARRSILNNPEDFLDTITRSAISLKTTSQSYLAIHLQRVLSRSQDTQELSKHIRARRSILNHPENFLDTVTKSSKSRIHIPHHNQVKYQYMSTATPHISKKKNNKPFKSNLLAGRESNKEALRLDPYKNKSVNKHASWIKKIQDLISNEDVEPYKHLKYYHNNTTEKVTKDNKINLKKYLEKLDQSKNKINNNNKIEHSRMFEPLAKFENINHGQYAPIAGRKTTVSAIETYYDTHIIRNSADLSKDNFEEMSLPRPDIDLLKNEVERILREKELVQKLPKRFKTKNNINDLNSAGNSKVADIDKKLLRDDYYEIKKNTLNNQSMRSSKLINKQSKVITPTNTYKYSLETFITHNDYKNTSIPTENEPYDDSTKQTKDFSGSRISVTTAQITHLNEPNNECKLGNSKKHKNNFGCHTNQKKKLFRKSLEPSIQQTSESGELSDISNFDQLRKKAFVTTEKEFLPKYNKYVSETEKISKIDDLIDESIESQSNDHAQLRNSRKFNSFKYKKDNILKKRPQKNSTSESSDKYDVSIDNPNSLNRNYLAFLNKPHNIKKTPQKPESDIPPNDHNKYILYIKKLMMDSSSQVPKYTTKKRQAEIIISKKLKESGTKTRSRVSSSNENKSDNIANILRDLLRKSRYSLDSPDDTTIRIHRQLKKPKLTRSKHPDIYIMVV